MNAYSEDLRSRILAAVDAGMSKCEAARVFAVSRSTIKRYAQQRRETGTLAPKPAARPRPRAIGPAHHAALRAQLEADPEATLAEHAATWERAQGVRVSLWTMRRAVIGLGWTRKKRPSPPASGTRRPGPPGGRRSPRSTPPTSSSLTRRAATGG
jgi:transposase